MSRNTNSRRTRVVTSVTLKKQRRGSDSSSSLDLSDDGGYSALEDGSDSEDNDEEDVAAVEEENILEQGLNSQSDPSRPQSEADEADSDHGFDPDDDDSASWNGIVSEPEQNQVSDFYQEATAFHSDPIPERRVRFDIPPSDSDSTDTEDDHADLFPDIFVSQTALDPSFRREIEYDLDDSSGSGTFWDHHGHYNEEADSDAEEVIRRLTYDGETIGTALPISSLPTDTAVHLAQTFEESHELDGYETDGDTTEEDIPEPLIRRKTHRPPVPVSDDTDSEVEAYIKPQKGQPRAGRFKLDRSDKKPIGVLNPLTRKMMIFTPHKRRQLDLSPEHFDLSNWPIGEPSTPLLSSSANLMLSAMFSSNTFGDFVNTQAMGPAEAFFPYTPEMNTADEYSSNPPSVNGADEVETKLDIEDFITWGDEDESSANEAEQESNCAPSSTPARPTTASSDVDMLSHLNSETVGAFRRNQVNQQLILSNKATQDSLAFSGPYNYTTIKGLKSDRFETASVPLTPVRRHKRQASDLTRSPLETISAKRKASSEAPDPLMGHKRSKSISDVNYLRI